MKLAIISDSHDNVPNIDEALKIIKAEGIETIIHCGDVCAPSVFKYLAENFPGHIHFVYGNVDGDHGGFDRLNPDNITIHGERGELTLGGPGSGASKKIAFIHYPDKAKELAATGKYDLVFYGHNHKPWEETIGQTKLVNPGSLAGLFSKATFAMYDTETGKLDLKILYI